MIYLIIALIILSFILLLFFLKLRFVIAYDKEISTRLEFLFLKKKLKIKKSKENDSRLFFDGLVKIKQNTLDLYNRFSGRLKIKSLKINATIASDNPFYTAMLYGALSSAIAVFVGILDSNIGIDPQKRARINTCIDFSKNKSELWLELVMQTSLFSVLLALTYSFFKMVFRGGQNGRKQANRNNKNRA